MESAPELDDTAPPEARRAAFRASWDVRLLPLLTAEWQGADALALLAGAAKSTVLERLKDMATRGLAERRIVQHKQKTGKKRKKRPRVHTARFEAQFRLPHDTTAS